MECREAARLISQGMDAPLPWWQRAALRFHLAICDACTNFSRQVRLLREAIRRLA
ncbi:MAG TPA: zf-HC2 domain-containing protein [Burkholderiales bacterium]|nr:zf-HC2 domain-containing protein [Burkholderiales bacterium]